jgi:hypothetical protein
MKLNHYPILVPSETEDSGPDTAEHFPKGSGASAGNVPIQQLTITNGYATAVWEWISEHPKPAPTSEIHFGIVLSAEPSKAAFGTSTVNLSFAPTSCVTTAAMDIEIPRFADTSTALNAFTVVP